VTACKSCGAPVRWAKTRAGKWVMLNPEPRAGGNVELVDGLVAVVPPDGSERLTAHFSDCPNANGHRKVRARYA